MSLGDAAHAGSSIEVKHIGNYSIPAKSPEEARASPMGCWGMRPPAAAVVAVAEVAAAVAVGGGHHLRLR